jgi:hypothetical protein
MSAYTGLLSTLVGGIHMDAWLKNWIDEWEEGYDELEAAKKDKLEKKSRTNLFRRFFASKEKVEA